MELSTILVLIISLLAVFIGFYLGNRWGSYRKHNEWLKDLPNHRKEAILRSRAVLGGHFTENLAPFLPDFPFRPNECTFIGKPIDFLVFKGSDEKNIEEVIFVEVKSGKAKLSNHEKNLKETIEKKRVRYVEYRIPEELTKKDGIDEKIESFTKHKEL